MESKSKEEEILTAFSDFWQTYAQRTKGFDSINDIKTFFDVNISSIGTGEHEIGKNFDEVVKNFSDDLREMPAPISINFFYKKANLLSPTSGLVEAEAKVIIPMEDETILNFHLRFTSVFVFKKKKWLLSHNHVSIPANEQDIGSAFPIDALKAKNNRLKQLVSQRTQDLEKKTLQLQVEKDRTEKLLYNILPRKIANELLDTGKTEPARHEEVTVLFTDFKEFTKVAATISARKVVEELNDIFFHFDDIIKVEQLEKIKTIGDSYMAVCGLPEEDHHHAYKCINAAKKMLYYLEERNRKKPLKWEMRIGVHSGPVVAGVVGNLKFTYDLWGNTVNLASRIEGAGEAGMINISEQTYQLIKDKISCKHRGKIEIKGKKSVDMYFVG